MNGTLKDGQDQWKTLPLNTKGKEIVGDRQTWMCIGYTCIHYVSYMFINAEIFRDHEYLKYIFIS